MYSRNRLLHYSSCFVKYSLPLSRAPVIQRMKHNYVKRTGLNRYTLDRLRKNTLLTYCNTSSVIKHSRGTTTEEQILKKFRGTEKRKHGLLLKSCTNEELVNIAVVMAKANHNSYEVDDYDLMKELTKTSRMCKLSKEHLLLAADSNYLIAKDPDIYLSAMYVEFDSRWEDFALSATDVLQITFYLLVPGMGSHINLLSLIEKSLVTLNCIDSYNLTELNIICGAFFCCNTSIKNITLLDLIANKTLKDLEHIDYSEITNLVTVLKALTHGGYDKLSFYEELSEKLCEQEIDLISTKHLNGVYFIGHLCKTYFSIRVGEDKLFAKIENFCKLANLSQKKLREKDVTNIIVACASLGYPLNKTIIEQSVKLWGKKEQMLKYPDQFVEFLMALVMSNVYKTDLISYALSPQFLAHLQARSRDRYYQMLLLDTAVKLKNKKYKGHRLPKEFIKKPPPAFVQDLNKELSFRKGMKTLLFTLQYLFNDIRKVDLKYIFTFSQIPDIEIEVDINGNPQELSHFYMGDVKAVESHSDSESASIIQQLLQKHFEKNSFLNPSHEDVSILQPTGKSLHKNRKISCKVYSFHQYLKNQPRLMGRHQLESRLLAESGYTVVQVHPSFVQKLSQASPQKRQTLVLDKILKPLGIKIHQRLVVNENIA